MSGHGPAPSLPRPSSLRLRSALAPRVCRPPAAELARTSPATLQGDGVLPPGRARDHRRRSLLEAAGALPSVMRRMKQFLRRGGTERGRQPRRTVRGGRENPAGAGSTAVRRTGRNHSASARFPRRAVQAGPGAGGVGHKQSESDSRWLAFKGDRRAAAWLPIANGCRWAVSSADRCDFSSGPSPRPPRWDASRTV